MSHPGTAASIVNGVFAALRIARGLAFELGRRSVRIEDVRVLVKGVAVSVSESWPG
jgi:hypothetical protein